MAWLMVTSSGEASGDTPTHAGPDVSGLTLGTNSHPVPEYSCAWPCAKGFTHSGSRAFGLGPCNLASPG